MALGTVFALGSSTLFFGDTGIWLDWLGRLIRLTQVDMPASAGNYNTLRPLEIKLSAHSQIALALVLCALTLGFLWWGRKSCGLPGEQTPEARRERELIEYAQLIGMGCLVHMMVSSLVWLHYYLLAIPMLIVAFRPLSRAPAHGVLAIILQRLLPVLIFMAFLNGPHWTLIESDIYDTHAIVMFVSAATLYGLGLWQLRFQDGRLPVKAH
jgi:hypothetical protein